MRVYLFELAKIRMGLNQKIEFRYFHQQLLSDNLTKEEKDDLWVKIQSTYKDEELELLMREYWQSLEKKEIISDEIQFDTLKNQILSRIQKSKISSDKTSRPFLPNWKNMMMRVAAMLFIPLLLGSLFVIYRMETRFDKMASSTMQQVIASPGSRVHLFLPDQTEVWLNSGSMLEFPTDLNKQSQRKVKLYGQGYFNVSRDPQHPFLVETESLNIRVLGTSFDVSNYANDCKFSSTLEHGSIVLLNSCGKEIRQLEPGQRAVLNKETKELFVETVDTKLTTSWKDGKLIFRNTSLIEVTKQMERWFNCKINVDPELIDLNILYTATIQDETLGEVLKMIEISTSVKTKIEKREVSIWHKNK